MNQCAAADDGATQERAVTLLVNGQAVTRMVATNSTLLDFLRDQLNLTGTKQGCDLGECGCCSVLIDTKPMLSCLMLAVEAEGRSITTIEAIGAANELHPVQTALVEEGAIQCGFCTPAMVINGVHLYEQAQCVDTQAIAACASATICRCTGYSAIERAYARAIRAKLTPAPEQAQCQESEL